MLGNNVKSMEVMGKDYKNDSCYSVQGKTKTALTRQNTSTGSEKVLYSHVLTGTVIH